MRLVSLVSAASFFSFLPRATRANNGGDDDPLISQFPSLVGWFREQGGTSESFPLFFAVPLFARNIPIRDKYRC